MFEVLLASGPHPALRTRWLTTSVMAHIAIITLVVVAPRAKAKTSHQAVDRAVTLLLPKVPDPAPPELSTTSSPSRVMVAEPPQQGFRNVLPSVEIPKLI